MDGLERKIAFLDQQNAIKSLFKQLNSSNVTPNILLKGNSGTGKSFIANGISNLWNSNDDKNVTIYVTGDIAYSNRRYYPFITCLSQLKRNNVNSTHVFKGITELSKGIPFVGDFVGYLIETLGSAKETTLQHKIRYLNDFEKLILFDFEALYKGKNILLVVDNMHWLDKHSLDFIQLILDSNFQSEYPVFSTIKFLLVFTENQQVVAEKEFLDVSNHPEFLFVKTTPIQPENYLNALAEFGFVGLLNDNLVKILYSYTGGSLVLIKRLAEYLAENKNTDLTNIDLHKSKDDPGLYFIENLLLYKLKNLGASGEQITALLEFASVIGVSFSKEELLCISKENEVYLKNVIQTAKEIQLIDESESVQKFAHEVLRYFFLNRLKDRKFSYYLSFSECLNKLRPSDYSTRAKYLFEAGNTNSATIIYILGVFKDIREGLLTTPYNLARIKNFSADFDLENYFDAMNSGYTLYLQTKYHDAIYILDQIEDWLPKPLLAEKYYLLALCLSKTMITSDLEKARVHLTGWDDLKEEEGEIWTRIMSTLMTLNINLYDYNAAKIIEKKIIFYLSDRVKFDSSAKYNLNIIRRNSSAAHINEIACIRTQQSVNYFTEKILQSGSIHPIQLYYSLTNHSANLIVSGAYIEAFEFSSKALTLVNTYKSISFPEPQIPANNYILSGILSNKISSHEALRMFEIITPYKEFVADEILIKNNYAVMHIYNNKLDLAFKILNQLDDLCKKKDIDPYYVYFVRTNLAGLQYILGMDEEYQILWKQLKFQIPRIPDSQYLEKRHELLDGAEEKIEKEWKAWDHYLDVNFHTMLGKSWKFYSKGFLLSDIQLWYES